MRKNNLFLICLFVLSASHVYAQKKVYVTPKAGIVLSNITNIDSDMQSGLHIGCGVEWRMMPQLGIETGLYYAGYGADKVIRTQHAQPLTVKIDYFQLPLLAKYYAYKGLHLFAGPQLGYKINTSEKPYIMLNYGKKVDFDGVAGIGYQFDFGFVVSANYVVGLTSNDQNVYGSTNGESLAYKSLNCRNSAFQFNIGWRF